MKKIMKSLLLLCFCFIFSMNAEAATVVKSGEFPCLEGKVTWSLNSDGVLTFSGSGSPNLDYYWYDNYQEIYDKTKKIVIQGDIKIVEHYGNSFFEGFDNVTTIEGISCLDVTEATSLFDFFSNCSSLTTINANFGSTKATNFSGMFCNCYALETVNLNITNTTQPSSFEDMFANCTNLKTIVFDGVFNMELSDTSNYEDTYYKCTSLKDIDIRKTNSKIWLPVYGDYSDAPYKSNARWVGGNDGKLYDYHILVAGGQIYKVALPKVKLLFQDGAIDEEVSFPSPSVGGYLLSQQISRRTGYTYQGHYIDKNYSTKHSTLIFDESGFSVKFLRALDYTYESAMTDGITFYTKWNPIKYYISYSLNGGTDSNTNPSYYTVESGNITLKAPTKEGYKFLGWYTSSNQLVETIDVSQAKDVSLIAKWQCTHANTRMENYVAATCCKSGYTGDVYCSSCSTLIAKGEIQNPTGNHNLTVTGKIEAKCTQEGNTGGQYCINSGLLITPGSVIPATGIHAETIINQKDATCSEEGYSGDIYCTSCKTTLVLGIAIEPTGRHEYNTEGKVLVEATKEAEGSVEYTCKHCPATKVESIPKLPSDDEPSDSPVVPTPDIPVTPDTPSVNPDQPSSTDVPSTTPDSPSTEEPSINPDKPSGDDKTDKDSTGNEEEKKQTVKKPSKVSSLKLKNVAGKKLKVSFKKQSGCKYQIYVSTDKKFKKSVKKYTSSKTSYTAKKLKKGKIYYVKVRAYKKVNGKTYYGSWSSIKKVKIKK